MRPNNGNPYAPIVRKTVREEEPVSDSTEIQESAAESEGMSVPDDARTVKAILDWVDEDADRALLALEQEEASSNPRSTLVDRLEDIINA